MIANIAFKPKKVDCLTKNHIVEITEKFVEIADLLDAYIPYDEREKTIALEQLQTAKMWAIEALATFGGEYQ